MRDPTLKIAIVGAGPAGFFAAEALLKDGGGSLAVDLFNRLPAPYGLVRDGVAPDHQAIKSVARVYSKLLEREEVGYFGAVNLGGDVEVAELRAAYDQIVYAMGAQSGRRLGIPGEDLDGSRDATSFVGWYNGHPEYRDARFDLGCERVVVVGNGNVAVDVARILVHSPDRLAETDIADHALEALRRSRVREVVVLGRRGPGQAAFTNPELREFGRLPGVSAVAAEGELELDAASRAMVEGDRVRTRNMATLRGYADTSPEPGDRIVRFRFFLSPVEIIGREGRTTGVRAEANRLEEQDDGRLRAVGTGEFETFPCGLALRSVGYRGVAVPGVPFDERSGTVPNEGGRVLGADGRPVAGEYVVGWAKRGPSGVIGTNKADAAETVAAMREDREAGIFAGSGGRRSSAGKSARGGRRSSAGKLADCGRSGVAALLRERGVRWVDKAGWARMDAMETAAGKDQGRPRVKLCTVDEMLAAAGPPGLGAVAGGSARSPVPSPRPAATSGRPEST